MLMKLTPGSMESAEIKKCVFISIITLLQLFRGKPMETFDTIRVKKNFFTFSSPRSKKGI